MIDIRRIGPTHASPFPKVLFGELFDDDDVQQYYEALVGTLKCAKKRGVIHFKGQILLKGIHDKVTITIVEEGVEIDEKEDEPLVTPRFTPKGSSSSRSFRSSTPRSYGGSTPKSFFGSTPKSFASPTTPRSFASPTPPRSFSYMQKNKKKKQKSPPIKEKLKSEITGTYSDSEAAAPPPEEERSSSHDAHPIMIVASDSECVDVRKSPRRLIVPNIFRSSTGGGVGAPRDGLPPRVVQRSPRWSSSSKQKKTTRRPLIVKCWSEQVLLVPKQQPEQDDKPPPAKKLPAKLPQRTRSEPVLPGVSPPKRSQLNNRKNLSVEVANQVQGEVIRLLGDIRRVGSNPGEPSVLFGELFDDEEVQNTYEALIGTLRSAKRQGLINFQGQMLLKGMHDKVEISVVEQ